MDIDQHEDAQRLGVGVPEESMCRAISRVLAARPDVGVISVTVETTLEALELDSLCLAEVIVDLEEELSALLELRPQGPMRTVSDLCQALQPIG